MAAADRISAPAIALTVLGWLNLVGALVLIGIAIAIFVAAANADHRPFGHQGGEAPPAEVGIVYLVMGLVDIAVSIFLLIGTARMRRLQNYPLAMATAIVALVPCTSPCCFLLGLGFGIWALVVLCDANVKAAFRH